MSGGAGNDSYLVESSGDVIVDAAGTDTVYATASSYTLASSLENLFYSGGANFTGNGNSLANFLRGGAGGDTLNGKGGADRMEGGAGDDTYLVDQAGDVVDETRGSGIDTVMSAISYTLGAELENLTLTGTAPRFGILNGTGNALANEIIGSVSANLLLGRDGADTLIGREGSDRLDGGMGSDILTGDFEVQSRSPSPTPQSAPDGSAYQDVFVFNLGEANGDIVTDFWGAGDEIAGARLELSGYGEGSISQVGKTDHYTITPDEGHGGVSAAETIQLVGVFTLNTGANSSDYLFV
jgi:serralysin